MKYFWFSVFSVLTSCSTSSDQFIVQSINVKKYRQKIAQLQKKLEIAETEKEVAISQVETLSHKIDEAKLALIRAQIDDVEMRNEKPLTLFIEEREALYDLIQTGPSLKAFEAQVELDRILRIITEISNEEKYVY